MRMFGQSTYQNRYPLFGWLRHWTALTAGRFRRCLEEKTTRSDRLKFRLLIISLFSGLECSFLQLQGNSNSEFKNQCCLKSILPICNHLNLDIESFLLDSNLMRFLLTVSPCTSTVFSSASLQQSRIYCCCSVL